MLLINQFQILGHLFKFTNLYLIYLTHLNHCYQIESLQLYIMYMYYGTLLKPALADRVTTLMKWWRNDDDIHIYSESSLIRTYPLRGVLVAQ
jgi:hypothetical protein